MPTPPVSSAKNRANSPLQLGQHWLWKVVIGIVALTIASLLFVAWTLNTVPGLRVAVSMAERLAGGVLTVEGLDGKLSGPFKIAKLHFESDTQLIDATDISFDWQSRATFSRKVIIDSLRIARLTIATKPSNDLAKIPTNLTLSAPLEITSLHIDHLQVVAWEAAAGLAPVTLVEVRDIQARIVSDGRFHKVTDAVFTTVAGKVAASLMMDGAAPFNLAASAKISGARDDKAYEISADVSGTLDAIVVSATATGWNLSGDANIKLTPFARVPVQSASINMGEIDPAAFSSGAPKAALTMRANLVSDLTAKNITRTTTADATTSATTGAAFGINEWVLTGPIEITNRNALALDLGGIPITSVRADAEWKNNALTLRNLSLTNDPGATTLTGTASLRNRVVSAELSVTNLDPRLWVSTLKSTRLNGGLTLMASETMQSIDAKLQEPGNKIAPWRGELIAAHKDGEVEIKAVNLLAGNASLKARGHLSLIKNRAFNLSGGVNDFDPSRFADLPRAKLNAGFNASGELKPELSANIKFDLRDSVIMAKDGVHLLAGRGDIQFTPSRLAHFEVMLDLAGNRFDANGAWGRADDQLKFTIAAPSLDTLGFGVSGKIDATGELAGTMAAPTGEINAKAISLNLGSGFSIEQAMLNVKLSPKTTTKLTTNSKEELTGALDGALKIIGVKHSPNPPTGAAPVTLAEQIDVNLSGTRASHTLRLVAKVSEGETAEIGIAGGLMSGSSAVPVPTSASGLDWQGSLDRLTIHSRFANLAAARSAPLALSWQSAHEQFKLGMVELRSTAAISKSINANTASSSEFSKANAPAARVRFIETEWTPMGWRLRGDVSGLQLQSGLQLSALRANKYLTDGSGINAITKLRSPDGSKLTLGADWDLRATDHLNGSLRVFRESGDIQLPGDIAIVPGLTDLEIKLTAVQDKVSATLLAKGEKLGSLSGSGAFELQRAVSTGNTGSKSGFWQLAKSKPIELNVSADMASISWLGPLIDPALQLTGKLRGALNVKGTGASPVAMGSLRGSDITAAWPDEGFKLSDGDVDIDFADNRAKLSRFSFRADPIVRPREGRINFAELKATPGTLTGSGELALADGKGAFKFKADKLALIQRSNRWLMLSGETTVNTAWDAVGVNGKLRADVGYFEIASAAPPHLSDDVLVRGRTLPADKAVRFSVDIDVDLGNQLYFNGRGLSTRLAGALSLRAQPKSALRVLGSVSAVSGTFDAYGQYLTIERGILNFQGPIETAGLNVLALRKGLAVEAGVEITGSVAEPRVRLVSEPNVPDTEKLSWIVVGRGQDQAGSSDSALLLSAATAILGGSSDSLPRQIAQGLGFDQLTVSSGSLGGNQSSLPTTTAAGLTTSSGGGGAPANLNSQIVTLGKRLSANAYVSYEQSLAGASSVVKLTYNLSRRISIIVRAGTDNSIDLSYTFSFN